MRQRAARRRIEEQLAALAIFHSANPQQMHREYMKVLDDRSVFERLLERAREQMAEREAAGSAKP